MKSYIHLLAPLALWAIGLALYIVTIQTDMPKRVDSIKTYRMQKKPHTFADAWYNIKDSFVTNWPDDTCYTLTEFSGNAACKAKRTQLKTDILAFTECSKYSSESCNCINRVVNAITSNTTVGKNLGGWKDSITYAIESCRWLMHNPHTAIFSGKVWVQKTSLLLFILTLATGNAFDWVVVNYMVASLDTTSASIIKAFFILVFSLVPMIVSVTLDMSTWLVYIIILVPPLLILFLYEMYKGSYPFPERPFVHPFVFACTLSALTMLAHAEQGILDYDIFVFEAIKSNVAAYIYLQVVWKYMSKNLHEDFSYSKFVQEGTLRAVILVFFIYVIGLSAPYPMTNLMPNFMWYTPLLWVTLNFAAVVWVRSFDYNEYFGEKVINLEKKYKPYEIKAASRYVSAIGLIFYFMVLLYYLREHSSVFRALIDNYPIDTMQYNATATWQLAPAIAYT